MLLLFASMINYMDRQTLTNLSVRITEQFELTEEQYGDLEFAFGVSFAVGALSVGMIVDRVSLRWFYPTMLLAWSAMGFATGLTRSYESMLVCRALLGFFESAHIPCAMVIIQSLLSRGDRVMGSSILQSGASLGAILTPLIIRVLVVPDATVVDGWRLPFLVVGAAGMLWAAAWLLSVSPRDLRDHAVPRSESNDRPHWLTDVLTDRRFWALCITTLSINVCWHSLRVWLPKFLQQERGYSESETLYFTSAYYVAADIGCILTGIATLWLTRRGVGIHAARVILLAVCSALTTLTAVATSVGPGWLLLTLLLLVAAGALGVFPCYYAQIQEFGAGRVGRVAGMLSFTTWMCHSTLQKVIGSLADSSGSLETQLAIVGCVPMFSVFAMLLFWRERSE